MTGSDAWHRVSPMSFLFFLFRFLRQVATQALPALIVLAASVLSSSKVSVGWIVVGGILLLLLVIVIAFLSYLRFRYRLHAEQIQVRSGILHREELNIDFDRVQNISIKELFYMRPFGLCVMSIDTAGSSGKEIDIAGVPITSARTIRENILDKRAARNDSTDKVATVDTVQLPGTDDTAERLLLHLGDRDVALYGLTTNFLLWVAIAFGAFFSTGDFAEETLDWLAMRLGLAEAVSAMVQAGNFLGLIFWSVVIFLAVAVLLPLLSVLGSLFRYHDYRLTEQEGTYRRESGLATRHQESVKRTKIQAVVCKQNAVARLLGLVTIQLRQASAGKGLEGGQLPGMSRSMFIVPSLKPEQAASLSKEFLPGCQPAEVKWSPVNRRRYMRLAMAGLTVPATLLLMIPAILVSPLFLLPVPILAAVAWPILHQTWKRLAYGVVEGHGFVRSGFIGTTVTQFPLFKVQRIDLRQTPWQRRAGFAQLRIHLASHSLTVPHMPVEDAERFGDLALYHAESSRLAWF